VLLILLGLSAAFQTFPDTTLDTVISQALDRNNQPFFYRELGRTFNDAGGVVYLALEDRETGERIPDIVDWLVIVRRDGIWQAFLPGDYGYRAAFDALSPNILTSLDDSRFRMEYEPSLTPPEILLNYELPWEDGRWATVTRSFADHGTGRIDFDLSSRAIVAAKDGIIIYATDTNTANTYGTGAWWRWNVVIIQHGDHEYSLYGHLAPDSLVSWIPAGCTEDFSQANCNVPIRAGEVLAEEGSTGYSSSPHLHVEFGQAFGIVGYGNASDSIAYTGYVYAEHNVGFSGYTPQEVSSWAYGRLVQAMHNPAPNDANLVRNGSFDDGTAEWTPSGQVSWSVQDGTMRFLRLNNTEPPAWAAFHQDFRYGAPANAVFETSLQLGNASAYPKTVAVSLMNAAGREYGEISCEFSLNTNTPLRPYIMSGRTRDTWANVRLEFSVSPPDSAPAALVDQVSAHLLTSTETLSRTECVTP
jgi:murein DD-endopeptidase MepM/ murein hydrolase activator NlpD